jgi:magnesium-transporting ATPase (P-type)
MANINTVSIFYLQVCWKNLQVGDIVKVKKNTEVPADIIQFSSSNDQVGFP